MTDINDLDIARGDEMLRKRSAVSDLEFPHLGLAMPADLFATRLWQSMQSSGHLLSRDQVIAVLNIVDRSFAPLPPQPQNV